MMPDGRIMILNGFSFANFIPLWSVHLPVKFQNDTSAGTGEEVENVFEHYDA